MPIYGRTITGKEILSGWLPWLPMEALFKACLQRFRRWLGRPSRRHIRFSGKIAMHSYLPHKGFKDGDRGDHPGDIYVSVIISLCTLYFLLYTVFWEHHSYYGFMCLFILIIVFINIISYLCVFNAFSILPLYILCSYLFIYVFKVGGWCDLFVIMLFVLQCADYTLNHLTLTLTLTLTSRNLN